MGHTGNLHHPDVQRAISQAIQGARAAGKAAGILASSVAEAQAYYSQGAGLVACGSDVRLLTRAADALGTELKGLRP